MLRRSSVARISAYEFGHPIMPSSFGKFVRISNPVAEAWGPIQRTKLANGITVVTQDRKSNQTTLGLYVEAGAKFDPKTAPGLSHAMRQALLTSNLEESLFQIDRTMRAVGAAYGSREVAKRHIGWQVEVLRQGWQKPLEKLSTCIAVPRFTETDLERWRDAWDNALEECRWKTPRDYAVQQLEQVAFWREPLGNPRNVQPVDNERLYPEYLLKQYCKYFAPQRVTLAAINIDHNELVAAYQSTPFQMAHTAPHFKQALLERSATDAGEAAQWTPLREDVFLEDRAKNMGTQPDLVNDGVVAVGWLTYGAETSAKDFATALVCREVLNGLCGDGLRPDRNSASMGTRTFYKPFSSAGIIGFTCREQVGYKPKLQAAYEEAVTSLPAGKVTSAEATRAATRAAVAYYHDYMENQRDSLDNIACATFYGDAVLDAIKGVTADDCNKAFNAMKAAKPCAYSTGGVVDLPSIRSILVKNKLM